ncbi:hypothetical protein M0208_10485 [Sphingomonas sp. SUN019]|uniref:hypothetical protein n=1 Tax=Sphingomonas sp. SUN019 TaxID=2937788 RepID=UPI002164A419|nr:hypothetical protein [Sphingomonas sp. SUN019]UVO50921.1 hypothetical protein M0208_10485 [Sphingomonas sp. SUN019]
MANQQAMPVADYGNRSLRDSGHTVSLLRQTLPAGFSGWFGKQPSFMICALSDRAEEMKKKPHGGQSLIYTMKPNERRKRAHSCRTPRTATAAHSRD